MNRRLFLLLTVASIATPVLADDLAATKKAIQAQYDAEAAAVAKKDAVKMMAINTKDCVTIDKKGTKRTFTDHQADLAQMLSIAQSITVVTKIQKLTVKGDTAVVSTSDSSKITILNPQTKKKMVVTGNTTNEDTWVKINGVWLRKQGREISATTLIDGKPAPSGG
jgi:ketosteroid isomerase-like protein